MTFYNFHLLTFRDNIPFFLVMIPLDIVSRKIPNEEKEVFHLVISKKCAI